MANTKGEHETVSRVAAAATEIQHAATPVNVSTSKRTLLKAGWVTPVVLAVGLPQSSYAKNISGSRGSRASKKPPRPDRGP